jgi:hypothetical protein
MTPDRARPDASRPSQAAPQRAKGAVSAVTRIATIAIIVIGWALFALHKHILSAVSRTQ